MENYWMYQVEKLEEEEAKQEQQPGQHDGDEVWTVWPFHRRVEVMVYICSGGINSLMGVVMCAGFCVCLLDHTFHSKALLWIHTKAERGAVSLLCFILVFVWFLHTTICDHDLIVLISQHFLSEPAVFLIADRNDFIMINYQVQKPVNPKQWLVEKYSDPLHE